MAEEPVLTSPKVSIIVPVYKVEQYLCRCLDSIVAQTFTDWECILIDDGSPDNSGAICDEYAAKDKRFHVIHQENQGVSAARNAGLDAAKGDWIGFVDSDDWIEPEMYEVLLSKASENDSDICGCDVFEEFNSTTVKKSVPLFSDSDKNIKELLLHHTPGWLWIKIFRRSLINLDTIIRFDQRVIFCEDELLLIKLYSKSTKATYVSVPLYHYNLQNQDSITHIFSKRLAENLVLVAREIEKVFEDNKQRKVFADALYIYKAVCKYKILADCEVCNSETLQFFNEEKFSSCPTLSFSKRVVLFCAENKLIFLLHCLRAFRTVKNYMKNRGKR